MRTLLSLRAALCGVALYAAAPPSVSVRAEDQTPIWNDQGPNWTPEARLEFYSQDQGSRIMPLAWLKHLKQVNGQPFLEGGLSRYGYLQNQRAATACRSDSAPPDLREIRSPG